MFHKLNHVALSQQIPFAFVLTSNILSHQSDTSAFSLDIFKHSQQLLHPISWFTMLCYNWLECPAWS